VLGQKIESDAIVGILEEDLLAPGAAQENLTARDVVGHARHLNPRQSRHAATFGRAK
jgi:hypothetical protein